MAKYFFFFFFIVNVISLEAQELTPAEIKKLKIKKISTITKNKYSDVSTHTEWLYDANGNDTAKYVGGKRVSYKIIIYNSQQQVTSITEYSGSDGKETQKTIFTYKSDGSFSSVNTDVQFGMKVTEVYDTKGRMLNLTIPDGSVIKCVYNTKGQVIKSFSIPKNGGVKFTNNYTYNNKGKLISLVNKGEYSSANTYQYDVKNLLQKKTTTFINESGEKEVTTETYTYSYD